MPRQVVKFSGLSSQDLKKAPPLAKGDRILLRIQRGNGKDQPLSLPRAAFSVIQEAVDRLLKGERLAMVSENQEVSPTEASTILGISRPLVVLRMETGDLPFRYVGKHRRARMKDVVELKGRLDIQPVALDALAADSEDLTVERGL